MTHTGDENEAVHPPPPPPAPPTPPPSSAAPSRLDAGAGEPLFVPAQAAGPLLPSAPAPLGCAVARLDIGAFVMGSLDEEDTRRVREHVARCVRCRAEYDELAGLPVLLARLTEAEAQACGIAATGVAPGRLLAAAGERVHRARRLRVLAAAAAAFLVLLAGTAGWALADGDDSSTRAAPPSATATPSVPPPASPLPTGPPGRTVRASDAASGAGAELRYAATAWGSDVDLRLTGVKPGTLCRLDVYGTDGRAETASSWQVPATGYGSQEQIRGSTSIEIGDIAGFAVHAIEDDTRLLEIPPAKP